MSSKTNHAVCIIDFWHFPFFFFFAVSYTLSPIQETKVTNLTESIDKYEFLMSNPLCLLTGMGRFNSPLLVHSFGHKTCSICFWVQNSTSFVLSTHEEGTIYSYLTWKRIDNIIGSCMLHFYHLLHTLFLHEKLSTLTEDPLNIAKDRIIAAVRFPSCPWTHLWDSRSIPMSSVCYAKWNQTYLTPSKSVYWSH